MTLAEQLDAAVDAEVAKSPAAMTIIGPLINTLARTIVGTAGASGTSLENVLDVVTDTLDEAVVHYAHNANSN